VNERIQIGYVCYKGPHAAFTGEDDYGVCGSKAYAGIYLTIEEHHPNPRGETYTPEAAATALKERVSAAQTSPWAGVPAPVTDALVDVAYRAWVEHRSGRTYTDEEHKALVSGVEWWAIKAALQAAEAAR